MRNLVIFGEGVTAVAPWHVAADGVIERLSGEGVK